MKTKNRPFEGVLGNTVELRTLERLLASPRSEFNVSELGRMTGVSRESAGLVVSKFTEWGMLNLAGRKGNFDLYALNQDDQLIRSMKEFNDGLILKMFPEVGEVLDEIEEESFVFASPFPTTNADYLTTEQGGASKICFEHTMATRRGSSSGAFE